MQLIARLVLLLVVCLPLFAQEQNGALLSSEIVLAGKTGDVELRRITYRSDGLAVGGYMALPKSGAAKLPCLIHNRGGNWKLNVWNDESASTVLGKWATAGYVVVASQYRGANGGEGKDEYGGADVDDVLNLIPLLEHEPRADAARIGMLGASRGGMMAYLALTRTNRIAAAVIMSGLADLNLTDRPEMQKVWSVAIPDYDKNRDAVLAARSAVRWPEKLNKNTPLLLIHGTADWRAPAKTNAINMAAALLAAKHPFRLVLYEGGAHGVPEFRAEANPLMLDWLNKYVRDRKPWPSLEPHGD